MSRELYVQVFAVFFALTAIALGSMGSGCPHEDDDDSGDDDSGDDDSGDDDSDCPDSDGDGFQDMPCGGQDCDDANADAYPFAPEIADEIDNNCDGQVDEGTDDDDSADDDMDDDTDDDMDDDSDDDDDECTVSEVCTFLVDQCESLSYPTVEDCNSYFAADCTDADGYVSCSCDCKASDEECVDSAGIESCLYECYADFCY